MSLATLLVCLGIPVAVLAADCASCHAVEARLHAESAHAAALQRPGGSLFVKQLSGKPLSEPEGGYAFAYRRDGEIVETTAERGPDRAVAPMV